MAKTPAHLFSPDPAGEQVFASDDHRRVLARCNPGYGITFSALVAQVANDPFTYGITAHDEAKVGEILAELTQDGDVTQNAHGVWEATPDGWFKITNIKGG
jgi:hypothetical protein